MPGAPFRASTSRPESSASAGRPLTRLASLALSRAFSTKVRPVSSTSGTANSAWGRTSQPSGASSSWNSRSLPALPLARIRGVGVMVELPEDSRAAILGRQRGRGNVGGGDVGGTVHDRGHGKGLILLSLSLTANDREGCNPLIRQRVRKTDQKRNQKDISL